MLEEVSSLIISSDHLITPLLHSSDPPAIDAQTINDSGVGESSEVLYLLGQPL